MSELSYRICSITKPTHLLFWIFVVIKLITSSPADSTISSANSDSTIRCVETPNPMKPRSSLRKDRPCIHQAIRIERLPAFSCHKALKYDRFQMMSPIFDTMKFTTIGISLLQFLVKPLYFKQMRNRSFDNKGHIPCCMESKYKHI